MLVSLETVANREGLKNRKHSVNQHTCFRAPDTVEWEK